MNPELSRQIERLTEVTEQANRIQSYGRAFWRGVVSGIGATVGATLAIAIAVTLLHSLAGIDLLKPFVEQVLPYVEQKANYATPDVALPPAVYEEASPSPSPTSE